MRMGEQRQVRESRVSLGAWQSHCWEMNPTAPPTPDPRPQPGVPGAGRVAVLWVRAQPHARTARRSQQATLSPQRRPWEEAPSSKPNLLVQPRGPACPALQDSRRSSQAAWLPPHGGPSLLRSSS